MRINTNLTAMNTYTQYTKNNNKIASAVEKLSSGYSINSAADNAAGLAISEKMRAQIRGLDQASANSQDAISLVQTAEGNLSESTEILQRMRELAVQSSSDTNNDDIDRTALQDEFEQLQSELDDIAGNASFNKKSLLDGSLAQKRAKLSNVILAQSGLSVEVGNAAAGSYAFSVSVQQESAAISGKASTFTATSSSDSFAVGSVSNSVGESSLANGNYTVDATYDEANNQMVFSAKGDNGQIFKAILSESQLADAYGEGGTKSATLNFTNGDAAAFSFTLTTTSSTAYDTTNGSTMGTLADDISDALKLSATGGVDAQEATYGVYANLTGAKSVKLEAGMDSVTFSNGAKVNFNELTTSSVSTANKAEMTDIALTGDSEAKIAAGGKYGNLKAADNSTLTNGTIAIAADGTDGLKATIDGASFYCNFDADTYAQINTDSDGGKTSTLTFKDAAGNDAFTIDLTLAAKTDGTDTGIDASGLAKLASVVSAGSGDITHAGEHTFDATFGTTGSSFDVTSKAGSGLTFQVGANEGDEMTIYIDEMNANYLGVASSSVATQSAASASINAVDDAINQVSSQRAYLGAIQNRLDHKIANLDTSSENLTSAESQIRDVDMAKEMTTFTNANILQQAATAMLAQANSLPQNVLSLLG